MRRDMIGSYLLVFGGLTSGLYVGIFVVDVQPAVLGWLFGAGIGISGGAFIAAITSNEPLAGGSTTRREPLFDEDGEYLDEADGDWDDPGDDAVRG